MKQTYKKADAEVILFNNSDVVTTSGTGDINSNSGPQSGSGYPNFDFCGTVGQSDFNYGY